MGEQMSKIKWHREPARELPGETVYVGTVDGEAAFVIRGKRRDPYAADRAFWAFALTVNGAEHPVGHGGQHKRRWQLEEDCEREVAEAVGNGRGFARVVAGLRERRELIAELHAADADREAHRMTLDELREAAEALRLTSSGRAKLATLAEQRAGRGHLLSDGRVLRDGDLVRVGEPDGPWWSDLWEVKGVRVASHGTTVADLLLIERDGHKGYGETRTSMPIERLTVMPRPRDESPVAVALRNLRDNVLPAYVEGQKSNHEVLEHRGESTGSECWRTWDTSDVLRMIDDAARDAGVVL